LNAGSWRIGSFKAGVLDEAPEHGQGPLSYTCSSFSFNVANYTVEPIARTGTKFGISVPKDPSA
jgi:hypothetical protein